VRFGAIPRASTGAGRPASPGRPPTARRADLASAYAFVAPFMVLLLVFNVYVFASGFATSLTDAQGINTGDFVGLGNYRQLLYADEFRSAEFWRAAGTTVLYMLGCLATQVPAAFVLAYALNSIPLPKTRAVLRAAFFLPVLLNTVTTALLFRMFFNRDQGVVNGVLSALGARGDVDWLMNSSWAVPLLVLVSFWQWTGFHMVYFLAQLQTVDPSLYEAARMEGCSPKDVLVRITLPLMRPALTFVLVTAAIGGLQMFDLVFMLFPNASYGPGGAAKTLVAYIYDQGFSQQFLTGLASAIGWLTFLLVAGVSALQLRVLGLGRQGDV
jgi:ABC-type sugar transport system permease subunit